MDTRDKFGAWFIAFMFFLCIFSIVVVGVMDGNKSEKIRDEKNYSQGFRDGIECISLTNLEFSIKKESKTFGELRDICIERFLKETIMKIYLPIELELDDVASAISEKTDSDIYYFIKRLADPLPYEWVVELFKHLAEELKKCDFLEDEIGMTWNELMNKIQGGINE